jgi:hypothetical protein
MRFVCEGQVCFSPLVACLRCRRPKRKTLQAKPSTLTPQPFWCLAPLRCGRTQALSAPSALVNIFYIIWQTYVLRLDLILNLVSKPLIPLTRLVFLVSSPYLIDPMRYLCFCP